ncbi:CPBP family intramembrane glutamic endopeptidase [Mucilaginibacter agri]|uniref:CPBP family intramembrane metalloprotease n=1 Tax=Mucilaginibacter agri TaxID=2695265 RepID=A0A965ZEM7_9SPHI|nr:CPBP family intramembrane glutamic endopeptidase [Mucilaginibacter agri]NCD69320.1 CPBP family intramembrane metalloprotease [Mucilaginibacter agri]
MTDSGYSQMRPSFQFLLFIAVTLVTLLVGALIGMGVVALIYGTDTVLNIGQLNINTPAEISGLWVMQFVSTTLPILVIPVFYAYVVVKEPQPYLKLTTKFSPQLLVLVFFIMFMSMPIMEQLSNINERLVLPPFLKGVEDWMRAAEHQAEKATNILLKMDNVWDLIKAVLFVGGLTALVEELMFRGVLQTIFIRWTQNPHAAIWITAALFSAFHMEFFGFLPRLMLGIFFGYFVYWSGSIWTSVWAHFVNNGTAVVITYLYQHKTIKVSPDDTHVFSLVGYVFSIIITVLLLINYRNIALAARSNITSDGTELD